MPRTGNALASFALATTLAAVPASAAVIQISSNAERSPEYTVSGGGVGRLVGTITASIGGIGGIVGGAASVETIVLPSVRIDTDAEPGDRVYALAPLPLTARAGEALRFTASVDLALDLDGVSAFGVVPDYVFARGTAPYASYTGPVYFTGTLSTGADAGLQNVPEPASFALLGLGLAGLAAVRRRAASACLRCSPSPISRTRR